MTPAQLSRRAALSGLGLTVGSALFPRDVAGAQPVPAQAQPSARDPLAPIPISGHAGPGLEPFDTAMRTILDRHGLAGGALAIAKDGRLVLAKGYGWANVAAGEAVRPETRFGLASVSKPITAVAVLKLVEQGKLSLDDRVFSLIKIAAPAGAKVDARLQNVTVRHCLNHSGGWDRMVRGDPINWEPQICRALRLRPPLSARQFLSFVKSLPLDFAPGTQQKYSNVGYVALGDIVATLGGQSYERFVLDQVLKPMGIGRIALARGDGKYLGGEAVRHLPGTLHQLPAMALPMVDGAGGWSASVVDMVRFLTNLEGSRGTPVLNDKTRRLLFEPPPAPLKTSPKGGFMGLGWDSVVPQGKGYTFYKEGSYQGMRTYLKRLANGACWCLAYNTSMDFDPLDMQLAAAAVNEVRHVVEGIENYPKVDYFKEYP